MNVLLVGNPNVGKSALFNQMTGLAVRTSNYAGTTVTFTEGKWRIPVTCGGDCAACGGCFRAGKDVPRGETEVVTLIDVPGTYSLQPNADSERVAVDALSRGDVILNIVDATNLERNLALTVDLMRLQKPMMLVLNMWDEAVHKGVEIDVKTLGDALGLPVTATNGRSGEGVAQLGRRLSEACPPRVRPPDEADTWAFIGDIVSRAQSLRHRHHTFAETLEDVSIHPVWGLPLAVLALAVVFELVIAAGGGLVTLMRGLFDTAWAPLMMRLYDALGAPWLRGLLVGSLTGGALDMETAMGILTTGIYIPLGLVLPYLVIFYALLGFLEDWGYLPRLAVLLDRFFHRVGLHGYSVIPMMLATGCNIPGVLALRNMETRREKFITAAIMCTAIPCMAQTAVIFAVVGSLGASFLWLLLGSLVFTGVTLGLLLNGLVRGGAQPLITEIPPYRLPALKMQIKKLATRMSGFFREAVPLMMGGILLVQVLSMTGALNVLFRVMEPLTGLWGLPRETASAMLVGLIRKDAGVAMLEPLTLTAAQTVTAALVLILYFPCVATYTVLARELGGRDLLRVTCVMLAATLVAGTLMRFALAAMAPLAVLLAEAAMLAAFTLAASALRRRRQTRGGAGWEEFE